MNAQDLNLPFIGETPLKKKWLSMDDYLEFVLTNLKYTVDMKIVKEWKKKITVNEIFVIK